MAGATAGVAYMPPGSIMACLSHKNPGTPVGEARGMTIQYIQLGKHNHNAHIERFNRTYRGSDAGQYPFARLEDVREAA